MKLFVVTDGDYSNYRVLGIYSTLEKAEEAKLLYNSNNDIDLDYELDKLPDHPPGLLRFDVYMMLNGDTSKVKQRSVEDEIHWDYRPQYESILFPVWAEDSNHAIKIANEKRTQLIANNELKTDYKEWQEWYKLNRKGGD